MYDFQGAIKAGANPTDVMNFMAKQTGYNAAGATQAGAKLNDVLAYMAKLPTPTASKAQQPQAFANPDVFGNGTGGGVVQNIAKSTIGSQGIGGLAGRPIVSAITAGAQGDVASHSNQLAQITQLLIQKANSFPAGDPRKAALMSVVQENQKSMGIANDTMNSLQGVSETQGQNVGTALNSAATLAGFAGGGAAVANIGTKTVGQQLLHGAVTGAEVGGLQGAGGALQDTNANFGSVAKGAAVGALTGAVTGAGVEGSLGLATKVPGALSDVVSNLTSKGKQVINGRTLDEIIATPESDVYKLSAPERKAFYDFQQEQITNARTLADQKVKANLDTQVKTSQATTDTLTRQLQVASRDETIALRPKIRTALADQSKTYRALVDEAIAPHTNTPVSATELKQFVDNRFPNDPGMADAVNNKLGLTDKTVSAPLTPGELPSVAEGQPIAHGGNFNPSQADTTIGRVYEQAKGLKQDISSAATKGTRTYTPDEKLTDDAIHTLSDFMKSKGVDMSAPNQFWAKYAPIRNQLVSEAKPFSQAPTQTKMFANTLTRVAKGADVNNENFIAQVEDLLGQPLATRQKSIISQLTENEKQALASQVEAQEKLLANKTSAETQGRHLDSRKFETERLARRRDILMKVIKGIVGATAAGEVIRHAPF